MRLASTALCWNSSSCRNHYRCIASVFHQEELDPVWKEFTYHYWGLSSSSSIIHGSSSSSSMRVKFVFHDLHFFNYHLISRCPALSVGTGFPQASRREIYDSRATIQNIRKSHLKAKCNLPLLRLIALTQGFQSSKAPGTFELLKHSWCDFPTRPNQIPQKFAATNWMKASNWNGNAVQCQSPKQQLWHRNRKGQISQVQHPWAVDTADIICLTALLTSMPTRTTQ